ncbi:MAG: hypothetical protein K6F80_03005 [Oscillospiraceae bacterium]|nr:hypothetical protein [Oscillospiraceae bacterium]
MLTILEAKDLSGYRSVIANIPNSSELHISELTEPDGVKGYIVYAYEPEQVVIYALEDGGDLNYCDGLARSVLFKAEMRGIERAVFQEAKPDICKHLALLRFIKSDKKSLDSIAEIMDSCKSCKENPANT